MTAEGLDTRLQVKNIVFRGRNAMLMPKSKKLSAAEEAAIERLKRVAGRSMTRQELLEQRISWVYGNLPSKSRITREEVASLVRAREGE